MARRTKEEMFRMKNDVTYYLLQTKLDPHSAHELMIKERLENGQMIPYYIKGVKDFISTSHDLALELNREELMRKKDKEKFKQKQDIVDYVLKLSLQDIKQIYNERKNKLPKHEFLELHSLLILKAVEGEIKKNDVNDIIINLFQRIA
ncbi:hypothetical protein FJQ98_16570 [Lysinibacillus agricola]|uniref:Uncharacterized protein n=1 Tax=Lysinibacillus agricola TaxID=2590012 RepID=A0ABX7ALT4_9BACI|nr:MULTISPECIES: hypothetical protein [Lysinibacillus]KOS61457.1 hypothetical protein AN161_17860 [Lysinibacillus sp. FJAT-14222]QQP10860.1 hypothetical protein FJQ98_16570 [Lysinibacillus agricola]